MTSKQLQIVYGLCALIGISVTMYFNILFVIEHNGFSIVEFVSENYVNAASASIANDIAVVAIVFLIWSFIESQRLSIPHWWFYMITTFCVALAFSFPLFLLFRERQLDVLRNSDKSKD